MEIRQRLTSGQSEVSRVCFRGSQTYEDLFTLPHSEPLTSIRIHPVNRESTLDEWSSVCLGVRAEALRRHGLGTAERQGAATASSETDPDYRRSPHPVPQYPTVPPPAAESPGRNLTSYSLVCRRGPNLAVNGWRHVVELVILRPAQPRVFTRRRTARLASQSCHAPVRAAQFAQTHGRRTHTHRGGDRRGAGRAAVSATTITSVDSVPPPVIA